jgi:hypothetical protein
MKLWCLTLGSLFQGALGFHPLTTFGLGFFEEVKEGTVHLVYENGALLNETLAPGIHTLPYAYLGTVTQPFSTLEDRDCFGCMDHPKLTAKSQDGTTWKTAVNIYNRVRAHCAVTVVRELGVNYDTEKIGGLVNQVVKEAFNALSNDDLRCNRRAELDELICLALRESSCAIWGQATCNCLELSHCTIEALECDDNHLVDQWKRQTASEVGQKTTQMQAKSDAEEHKQKAAALAAKVSNQKDEADAANRIALELANMELARTKNKAVAENEMAKARAAREHEVQIATATAESQVQEIINKRLVNAAKSKAEAKKIEADVDVHIKSQLAAIISDHPEAASHEQILSRDQARHNNEKETTYVVLPASLLSLASAAQGFFGG